MCKDKSLVKCRTARLTAADDLPPTRLQVNLFTMRDPEETASKRTSGYFDGQMLVAMPGMADKRFAGTLIYICAHSAEGAMGIVINRKAKKVTFPDLLVQLNVIGADEAIRLPRQAGAVQVLKGGPVEAGRGFVLHSPDFFVQNSTLTINGAVSLTATMDILKAIATGGGPERALLALGYAGWAPGQLDAEIQQNAWLNCPADDSLVFDAALDAKYGRALRKLGIDLAMLSTVAGHA